MNANLPVSVSLTVAGLLLVGFAFYLGFRLGSGRRWAALIGSLGLVAAAPLLVPSEARFARFLVALAAVVVGMKLWDAHIGARRAVKAPFRSYVGFLLNPTALVWRRLPYERRPSRRQSGTGFAVAVLGTLLMTVLLVMIGHVRWDTQPFLVEHVAKAAVVFLLFTAVMDVMVHALRIAGGVARDFTDAPWIARTPGEFWRRYNRSIGQFIEDDVFKPLCHCVPTRLAIVVAFLVSGLLHEYAFAISVGRVEGYATLFFVTQGIAVAASSGLKARGWSELPAVAATLVFLIGSSILLFAAVDGVVRFYSRGAPV